MAATRPEITERLRQAFRRRREFRALAADVRDGRVPVAARPSGRSARPAAAIDLHRGLAKTEADPSKSSQRRKRPARRQADDIDAGAVCPLSVDGYVAELNRRLAGSVPPGSARYVVVGQGERKASWEGDESMRPLIVRIVADAARDIGAGIPFYADPFGRREPKPLGLTP